MQKFAFIKPFKQFLRLFDRPFLPKLLKERVLRYRFKLIGIEK